MRGEEVSFSMPKGMRHSPVLMIYIDTKSKHLGLLELDAAVMNSNSIDYTKINNIQKDFLGRFRVKRPGPCFF
jgi:hypothetical protein